MRSAPLLSLLLLLGCDLNQLPEDTSGAGDDLCEQACLQAETCDYCIADEGGGCFTREGCASWCRSNQEEPWAECFINTSSCQAADLNRCWDLKQNRCVGTCAFLESCDLCARDGAGRCLDDEECVLACLEFDDRIIDCVRAFDECNADHINACLSYAGSEACDASCSNLNLCGRCWPDGAGGCLDWNGCMGRCNAQYDYTWACLGAASCEIIDQCYGENSLCHDACRRISACEGADEAACLEPCLLSERYAWATCALAAEDACELSGCVDQETSVLLEACQKMPRCNLCFSDEAGCVEDARCVELLTGSLREYGACVFTQATCDLRPCDVPEPEISCARVCPKVDLCAQTSGCALDCEGWSSERRACALTLETCEGLSACELL